MINLTHREYHELGVLMGTNERAVKQKLRNRDGLNTWTVAQLRAVIKFLRDKHTAKNQQFPNWLSLNGRKAQLIDVVLQCMGGGGGGGQAAAPSQQPHPQARLPANYTTQPSYHLQAAQQLAAAQQAAYRSSLQNGQYQRLTNQYRALGYPASLAQTTAATQLFNLQAMAVKQQQVQDAPDVTKICQSKEFNNRRSPFFTVLKRFTACPVLPTRRSKFCIELDPDTVKKLHNKEGIALHLRLFDSVNMQHQEWNKFAGVSCQINNAFKHFPQKPSKPAGSKSKGYHIVKALDISAEASLKMQIVLFSQYTLTGIIAVELMTVHPVEDIAARVKRRCLETKKCEVCGATEGLLRCSRCKSAWYCGVEHQGNDWAKHQRICCPFTLRPKLRQLQTGPEIGGDDVVCGESRVSLRCPLTICRIRTPVRGADCLHPQCMDLQGFLGFSHRTSIWQCPVCMKALKYEDILVDQKMQEILRQTSDDVDQVRLYPDGTFVPITLEELREEDRKSQMVRGRKRKRQDENPDPLAPAEPGAAPQHTAMDAHQALPGGSSSAPVENTVVDLT